MTNPNPHTDTTPNVARTFLRAIAIGLLVPALLLIVLALMTPLTISGLLYAAGAVAAALGINALAWGLGRYRLLFWLGLALILVVAAARLLLLRNTTAIQIITLPDENATCILDCLIDEQDAALVSTRILPLISWISPAEQQGLLEAMHAGYQSMAAEQTLTPSPFVRTYLDLQRAAAFDAVVIEPANAQPAQSGIIFLHGFTGSFTMPCWLIAQAVRTTPMLTVCPSVSWRGDWWTANGEATLRATIDYLHRRGISRIYLAGLSNGAVGASELAYKLTNDLAGLILISGASLEARDSGLPVLVLAGTNDERMPADMLRAYADQLGDKATFVERPADHFMLAKDAANIQNQIALWIQQH